jgi:hypothetical protein
MKLLNLFVASVFTISSLSLAEVQIGQQTLPAGSQSSSASTASASVSTSNTTTTVGGQVRLLGTLFNSDDQSKPENYPFSLDRTRLWIKREQNGVEGYVQLRFESNQNGKDNEGKEPSTSSFVDVNRAYVNFKSVADGLDLQLGKQVYKFADDTDYGLTKTDVYEFFGKPNTDYGLGLFADYRLPNSVGTAHVAITNGNSKSNEENNSQKAVVTYFSIFPLLLAGSDEQGLRTNFGYAANVLKKDGDKNVLDAVLSVIYHTLLC